MPSGPATIGLQAMVSLETSLRNWARGLSAPFLWFFQAMRVSTSFSSSLSTPYLLAYAGASRLNEAGAVTVADGAVVGRGADDEAGVPGVLELLDADRHGDVVRAGGDGVAGVAERLAAGGAEVLDVGDRLVLDLQRTAERQAGQARAHRAEPERVDVVELDARRRRARPTTTSMSMSSVLLSQCSPKLVQPIPTMATLSRIPCDAMARSVPCVRPDCTDDLFVGARGFTPVSGFAFQK